MSDDAVDKEFRKLIDSFIRLANQHVESSKRENVAMALLYAAARFNSFVVASHATELNTFDAERPMAVEHFAREYLRMLNENLDDYRKVYQEELRYAHLIGKQ
jgi:hypothetical protein